MDDDNECYFCGNPGATVPCPNCTVAVYCNESCRESHATLDATDTAHKELQCKSGSPPKADYNAYVGTLPAGGLIEYIEYANSLKRAKPIFAARLTESIGYSLPPENQFFRMHEFLQAMVAHGEDTDENMTTIFGFQMTDEETERNADVRGYHFCIPRNTRQWRGKGCEDDPSKCGSDQCQGVCRRNPCDPKKIIARYWFQARTAVACGAGAEEGTHAYNMGAHAPLPIAEGEGASPRVLSGLQKWCLPGEKGNQECAICTEAISSDTTTTVQHLPTCQHTFHSECLKEWLRRHATCPMCRERIPESIPRPPTPQERNMAARLQQEKDEFQGVPQRTPIVDGTQWMGKYENKPRVLYRVSDELGFAGGACHIGVSPCGKRLAITSTSLGKLALINTETGSLAGTPCQIGRGFPGGAEFVTFCSFNGNAGKLLVKVDDEINRYSYECEAGDLKLKKEWSVPQGGVRANTLSSDSAGKVLVSESSYPSFWIEPETKTKVAVELDDVSYDDVDFDFEDAGEDMDYQSWFHGKCVVEDDHASGGVLTLPNGDICFLHGLFLRRSESDQVVNLGLLRRGQRRVEPIRVHGLKHTDFCGSTLAHFCMGPKGDIVVVTEVLDDAPQQPLVHITNPTTAGDCRGTCTMLHGFNSFEEFEEITVDEDNCLFLLVVINWPHDRVVYLVNPKV